jgi:drug/metabolite transporter (DMT)-like permease
MIINVLFSILGLTFANWVYAHVAYNKYFQERPFTAYAVSILAAAITTAAWVLLIRNVKTTRDVFITNLIWDVGATILCVTLPIIMFNVKLDMKTAIGCVVAIAGIIITKV